MSKPAKSQWDFGGLIIFLSLSLLAAEGRAESWRLIWSDEFNGPTGAGIDTNKWTGEFYTASPRNAALDSNGCLDIVALKLPAHTFNTSYGNGAYSSARLITGKKFFVKYGRIEARIKIPAGQGLWPAFWMLGEDNATVGWPQCGEVDIMENIGKAPDTVWGSLHGPGYPGSQSLTTAFHLKNRERFADNFHVFAIEWEENEIRWYVDGQLYERRTPADFSARKKWVFNKPFFLLLNLAVGGDWPDNPDQTTRFPAVMAVDYVRVYQR